MLHHSGNTIFQIRNGHNKGILVRFDIGEWKPEIMMRQPYYLSNFAEKDSLLYVPCAYGFWTYNMVDHHMEHIEKLEMATGGELLTDSTF